MKVKSRNERTEITQAQARKLLKLGREMCKAYETYVNEDDVSLDVFPVTELEAAINEVTG